MSFSATENKHLKIHMKKKTKMDIPLDDDYFEIDGKTKRKKKIKVVKLPPELPSKSFIWLLYGPCGSGKSTYTESIICTDTIKNNRQSYKSLFKKIIFYTPQIDDYENDDLSNLPDIFTEISLDNLKQTKEMATELYEKGEQTLVIFDDMASSLRGTKAVETELIDMCHNHRHYGMSIIFCCQCYKSVPPKIRSASQFMTIFSCDNTSERENIFEDLPISKKLYDPLFKYVFENEDDKDKKDNLGRKLRFSLYIDKSKKKHPTTQFYKNFDKLTIT